MTFEFKTILKKKYTFDNKMESSLQKTSKPKPGSLADTQESSITQILSQRLSNMEQQLKLLREDLKDAVETLKRKDQEITTLENKVALAERRRDAEKNGEPPAEDLRDLSEGVDPKLKSKQDLLQKECDTLSKKLQEMEKFFGDYGLAWVKEDAINETDQNNLWVRKTNIHYTPDFDKIFLVVEELNVGNAEPQIVRTENTAQFKTADLLHLTLYSDGIQLENNPFRQYDSPSVEEFFHDLEDGYFPSELRGEHPEGVIFKVKDMRSTRFADDPQKRPVVKRDRSLTSSPQRASTSSTSPAKSPTGKDRKGEQKSPSVNSGVRIGRRSKTLSLKSGTSIRKKIVKNVAAESTEAQKIADGKVTPTAAGGDIGPNGDIKPAASPEDETKKTSHDGKGVTGGEISPGKDDKSPKAVPGSDGPEGVATPAHGDLTAGAQGTEMNKGVDDGATPAPGGQGTEISGGVADGTTISASKGPSNNIGSENQVSVPQSTVNGLKQIFVAEKSPQGSSTRMSEPNAVTNEQKTDLEQERTLDSFGLPRPPLSPDGSSQVNKTKGPPLKHFENFFINKVGETQTSGTYIAQPPQNQPQPQPPTGNITNITYNEAPITIQMTPSELMGGERKTVPAPSKICCPIRTKPCDCANNAPPAVTIGDNDGIGTIELIKPIGETEYREKYSEGAANWVNVLKQKHKYKEQEAKRLEELGKKVEAPLPPDPTWDSRAIDPNLDTRPPDRFWDPKAPDPRWDPNVKWSNFDYFGHQKGQAASPPPPTPVSPATASKKQSDTPQIIQLNEKTSDRMISVKMRTRSGSKEYVAHLYPKESVKTLRSLLKMHEGDQIMIENEGQALTENTNLGDIPNESGRRLVVSSYGDRKPEKSQPERPNLGSTNPDLFKHYPGEIEVKRKKNKKKPQEKQELSDDYSISDNISRKVSSDDYNKSRDFVVSRYENRDWLSNEVFNKPNVPRVTSSELKNMLEEFKKQEITDDVATSSVSDMNTRLAPRILSDDVVSDRSSTNVKANYPSRTRKGLGNETDDSVVYRPTVIPSVEKSRSSSMISESQCHVNSFVVEPRKKPVRKNIRGNSSSFDVVEMDREFLKRLSMPRGKPTENQKSRDSSDISIQREEGENHSLIFRRRPSLENTILTEESSLRSLKIESIDTTPRSSKANISHRSSKSSKSVVDGTKFDHTWGNESSASGLKIESIDTISKTSKIDIPNKWSKHSKSSASFIENIEPVVIESVAEGPESSLKIESVDISLDESKNIARRHSKTSNSDVRPFKTDVEETRNSNHTLINGKETTIDEGSLSARGVSEQDMIPAKRASSSGIRGDGFESATMLEILDAMLRAQKEYESERIEKMGKEDVLVRKNSLSDVAISTEFVPPADVVQELEELKRSLGGVPRERSSSHHDQESDREFVEKLLEDLLSRKSTPEEVIKKLKARRSGPFKVRSTVPEISSKPNNNDNRRGRKDKKPIKTRRRRGVESTTRKTLHHS